MQHWKGIDKIELKEKTRANTMRSSHRFSPELSPVQARHLEQVVLRKIRATTSKIKEPGE